MDFAIVLLATLSGFALGAIYYNLLAAPWLAASALPLDHHGRRHEASSPLPYLVCFVALLLVAGMMRHLFVQSGIVTMDQGAVAGLGIGVFLITPWIFLNNAFAMRPLALSIIDSGYAVSACTLMGVVLVMTE